MSTFSNLLDIKLFDLRIYIGLEGLYETQKPIVSLKINGHEIYQQHKIETNLGAVYHVGLLDPICVEIGLHQKDYNVDHTTAIILKDIMIDNFNIVPNHTHHARYINDHNWNEPTTQLGFNGVWQFFIDEPFYQWHHRVTGQGWLLKPQH